MQFIMVTVARCAPWLRQTSTILGISTLLGVLISVATGELTWQLALPLAVGALVSMLLPEHPEAGGLAAKVAAEVVAATNPATRSAALRELGKDLPAGVVTVGMTLQKPAEPGQK